MPLAPDRTGTGLLNRTDMGSSPWGGTQASLAQRIARRSSKPTGLGSSPRRRTARWSSWSGCRPLKAEMTGSSPVRATQDHGPICYG